MLICDRPLKVVVTGASGFVGHSVLRVLSARRDIEVIAVTRKSISGWVAVSDYSESPIGDVLIHLAEDGDRAQVANAGSTYAQKAHATLIALLAKGYARVVYASSAVLYGDACARAHFPDDPVYIDDAYSQVKRQSELAVLEGSAGVVGRLANIYGPGMSKKNVMSTILRQIPQKEVALEVFDACPVRDFLWVEDAAEGIVALALNNLEVPDKGRVFNFGSGVGTSIGALAKMALEITGQHNRLVTTKHVSDRQSSVVLDYSGTTSVCGWRPKISLRDGLACLLRTRGEGTV